MRGQCAPTACRHVVSGSLSLPSRGAFHLSLTVLFTIGHQEYLALLSGLSGFHQDSACPGVLGCRYEDRSAFAYRAVTFCGAGFHLPRLTAGFVQLRSNSAELDKRSHDAACATPAGLTRTRFRLLPLRSPLLREYRFLRVLRCFSSPGALHLVYVFNQGCSSITSSGLLHSETAGSSFASNSPTLIAGSRVFLRLLVPRHPPRTLTSLFDL